MLAFYSHALLYENFHPLGYLRNALQFTLLFEYSILSAKYLPIHVLHRVRIVKLLTQHVVRGDFWVPTNGSPPWWWWRYQFVICIYDWFEMGYHFSPSLIQLGGGVNLDCCLRHIFIPRKRRGNPTTTTSTYQKRICSCGQKSTQKLLWTQPNL